MNEDEKMEKSRRGFRAWAAVRACLWLLPAIAAAQAPQFAVTTAADGVFHIYSTYTQVSATQYTVQDSNLTATVTSLGNNQWQLTIQAKVALKQPWFPWQTNRTPLDTNLTDDFYYYPYILGMSEQAANHNVDWTWWGLQYPGAASAPLVVMADPYAAIIVAATNWPPKAVVPMYAAQRLVLQYSDNIAAGSSITYSALIARVSGNESTGVVPWQLALDQYRAWLNTKAPVPNYPSWMWNGQGFLNVQLENAPFSTTSINNLWQPVKSLYPWMLFWGQMTSYAGGCCVLNQTMSSTYYPALENYVTSSVVGAGYHAGYYSAPYYSNSTGMLDTQTGVNWLTSWLAANQGYGANSFYIDTLGRQYYGNPAQVVNLFAAGTIPNTALIEGAVDIYPVPGLVSGALVGDVTLCGAPQKTPSMAPRTTFPRFGRYLLGDRLMYSGQSNTDYRFWGTGSWTSTTDGGLNSTCNYATWCSTNGPCAYGTERLNFLMGAKLDVMTPNNDPILDSINQARENVNWWARRPVYQDTKGLNLTGIPASSAVQISRFEDQNGATLIAVSNPNSLGGLSFTVDGATYAVPAQPITILDLGGAVAAPVISNGSPSGTLAAGTISATLGATTNENATCKYATSPNITYTAMPVTFAHTGGTAQSTPLSGLTAGSYAYYVKCADTSGNADTTDYPVQFSIAADSTPPTVQLTSPINGQTYSGTVQLSATASDNVGVTEVEFTVDGYDVVPPILKAPYTANWNSATVANGSHTVAATAWDAAGNHTVSNLAVISVHNK